MCVHIYVDLYICICLFFKFIFLNWDPIKVLSASSPDSIEWSSIPPVSYRLVVRSRGLVRFMFDFWGAGILGWCGMSYCITSRHKMSVVMLYFYNDIMNFLRYNSYRKDRINAWFFPFFYPGEFWLGITYLTYILSSLWSLCGE